MNKRLAILASFSGAGGVEHMLMNLMSEFVNYPLEIDLLTIRADSEHLNTIPEGINWLPLRANHSLTAIPEIVRYLRRRQPHALLAAKDRAGRAAAMARSVSGTNSHLSVRLGTNLSAALADRGIVQRWARTLPMPGIYRKIDQVIAISEGVALDTHKICRIPKHRIRVIRNPVITERMLGLAKQASPHPWLDAEQATPVIIGAGRLTRQKDFPTLIRAFSELRKLREARLVILGEGKARDSLESLVSELRLDADVSMPGFQHNPWAWIARASLFVLSSRWEGSGNVLTEAMALNTPVVSTDCPSGPAEMLQGGRIAPLVPMGDYQQLSKAMNSQLQTPSQDLRLAQAVQEYRADVSARRYLQALGLLKSV